MGNSVRYGTYVKFCVLLLVNSRYHFYVSLLENSRVASFRGHVAGDKQLATDGLHMGNCIFLQNVNVHIACPCEIITIKDIQRWYT